MRPRARTRVSEQQARDLLTTQSELTALTTHPSWPTLLRVVNQKQERWRKTVLAMTLGSGDCDPVKIGYIRGFIDGINYLAEVPERAEVRLERLLQREGIKEEVGSGNEQ